MYAAVLHHGARNHIGPKVTIGGTIPISSGTPTTRSRNCMHCTRTGRRFLSVCTQGEAGDLAWGRSFRRGPGGPRLWGRRGLAFVRTDELHLLRVQSAALGLWEKGRLAMGFDGTGEIVSGSAEQLRHGAVR